MRRTDGGGRLRKRRPIIPHRNAHLPKLELPPALLHDLRASMQRHRLSPSAGQRSALMARSFVSRYRPLILLGRVEDTNAMLNIVLRDLDRFGADPFVFGDTNPFLRFRFLLRSAYAEFERFPGLFDQYLRLCTDDRKLALSQRRKLLAVFVNRVRPLLDMSEEERSATPRRRSHANSRVDEVRGLAYLEALVAAAVEPDHTTIADWSVVMRPHVQAARAAIFAAGMEIVTVWASAIELLASREEGQSTRRSQRLSRPYRNPR
jgi:hypothetical protein